LGVARWNIDSDTSNNKQEAQYNNYKIYLIHIAPKIPFDMSIMTNSRSKFNY
jgi:hypothetical protein